MVLRYSLQTENFIWIYRWNYWWLQF